MARYEEYNSCLVSRAYGNRLSYTKSLKASHYGQRKARLSKTLRQFRGYPGIQGGAVTGGTRVQY